MQTDTDGADHPSHVSDHIQTERTHWSDFMDILSESSLSGGHGLSWLIDRMTRISEGART
ncbi:hypothetical protein [Maritimibacter sp. DP1N21-5]|uniref:hypothetical protein n=1 Tax=Maritimibacter sp. DP1N21-5 TaxID=2836867 RepID=UPI001C437EF0|nr:hypothetical protein [Maritimibacter sp. DP1N21-5]MBV7409105.1 hypothetical protein [Maritimibacter sp. DP1N21-5]